MSRRNSSGDHQLSNEDEELSEADRELITAVNRNDTAGVLHGLRNGADVNCACDMYSKTLLMNACREGYDSIVRILLEAGADAWRSDSWNWSAIDNACAVGHLSAVEILLNHDKNLLEKLGRYSETPLLCAIEYGRFEIAHFLLDRGANALVTTDVGLTTLMLACQKEANLEIVQRLLAAGVAVEARDSYQRTVLHYAAESAITDAVRELILEHNANLFAVDCHEETPFASVPNFYSAGETHAFLIETYGNELTHEHGQLALHAVFRAADYTFAIQDDRFHPPLNSLRVRLPLGELTLQHFRILLSTLDAELIRNRDDSGKLPIHIACQAHAPLEVLSMLAEMDTATLQIADNTGALPIHSLCNSGGTPAEYTSVQFLVEEGGVGTLAARKRDGALPLHVLCASTNPSLQTVQFLVQSFHGSVAVQTTCGQYPSMIAACSSSTASLSVVFELVRANPHFIVPR